MAQASTIEWTDAVWNPIHGCSRVSEGCRNCYAEEISARFCGSPAFAGTAEFRDGKPRWTNAITVNEAAITAPMKWRKPRRIFVNSMSDLFHDGVSDQVIDRIFAVMALCPHHIFQILTKRPQRMREHLYRAFARHLISIAGYELGLAARDDIVMKGVGWPLPNVWLGVSIEDQTSADARIPHLLSTPAAIRFASYEPALGPVDWHRISYREEGQIFELDALSDEAWASQPLAQCFSAGERFHRAPAIGAALDLIIMGGESGRNARPMHPDWARQTRDQCAAAGTAFFFKQWGAYTPLRTATDGSMYRTTKRLAGRLLDGVEHNALPGGT